MKKKKQELENVRKTINEEKESDMKVAEDSEEYTYE